MAEHITEEEQLEAFKRWWKENGTSLIIGVALAVGGFFAWQTWQTQQQQASEQASALYDDMLEAGIPDPGQDITEQQIAIVNSIADELMESHGSSLYAHNGAMLLAKIAVEQNQLDEAETHLRWVLDNGPSDSVKAIVNLRLATVLYSQDKFDDAMKLVVGPPDESFTSNYAELRGDINLAKSDLSNAKVAYQTALDKLLQSQSNRRDIIQMKLDDVTSTLADSAVEIEPPATEAVSETTDVSGEQINSEQTTSEQTTSEQANEEQAPAAGDVAEGEGRSE